MEFSSKNFSLQVRDARGSYTRVLTVSLSLDVRFWMTHLDFLIAILDAFEMSLENMLPQI